MKKVKYVSLGIILILSCYLIATALFIRVFNIPDLSLATRTPAPTFTPGPPVVEPVVIVATPMPVDTPTPTSTPAATPTPASPTPGPSPTVVTAEPTPSPPPAPQVVATTNVNVRAGPGVDYAVIGALPPDVPVTVIGRNAQASWWQISVNGETGWVAGSVVQASQTGQVAIAATPPPPPPTPTSPPPTPERPQYQYEPTGWFSDTNYGLTRFLGNITDADGNPVNGVYVQASCGGFSAISNPSGPIGGLNNEGADWPPGFYDLTLDRKPVPCKWILTVVTTDDQRTATSRLSQDIEIEVTVDSSIVTANWRKNW